MPRRGGSTAGIPENALRAPVPRFVGRFDHSDPVGPRFSWSASTIEARFSGSGIALRLRAAPPPPARANDPMLYTVRIDDGPPRELHAIPGDQRYVLGERLDPARPHVVTITRESEALAGVHQLLGFDFVPGGELLSPEPTRAKRPRLEIVGDSITCGYGVLGASAACHFSFETERATRAYGALAAAALGADATTVCWSGRGVHRNFDEVSEPRMPALYETVVPQDHDTARGGAQMRFAEGPQPDVVVVSLGTNDFLADADRDGKRDPLDTQAFEASYIAFLERVREVRPSAFVLVTVSPMLEGEIRGAAVVSLERIVEKRKAAGDDRIDLLVFEEQGGRVGCDGHPNAAMHGVLAQQLVDAVRPRLRRSEP